MIQSLVPSLPNATDNLACASSKEVEFPDQPKLSGRFLSLVLPAAIRAMAIAFYSQASYIPLITALKQTILLKFPSFSLSGYVIIFASLHFKSLIFSLQFKKCNWAVFV